MFERILLAAAVVVLGVPATCMAQVTVSERIPLDQPPLVEATLGAEGHFVEGGHPEVSLASIESAIAAGADMVRLPAQLTKDGHYVLMYGTSLNATTNVEDVFPEGASARFSKVAKTRSDYIADYTIAEIRQLRLTGGSDGGEHPVPTLEQALELIDGQALARINLVAYDRNVLLAVLQTYGTDNLVLSSMIDERWVAEVSAATEISVSMKVGNVSDPVAELEKLSDQFGPSLAIVSTRFLRTITPELVAKAEELGVRVKIWQGAADNFLTEGDSSYWEKALNSGATAFETAHPTLILEMLGR